MIVIPHPPEGKSKYLTRRWLMICPEVKIGEALGARVALSRMLEIQ